MTMTKELNPHQIEAVEHINGPLLVIAGAGSGKTRVVTSRIVNLIENGVSSSQILGLTFTNKAAGEMKERVEHMTQCRVLISTFHSLGARILRESISALGYTSDFVIYDEEDTEKLLKSCLDNVTLYDKKNEFKTIRSLISKAKNDMKMPGDICASELNSGIEKIFPEVYAYYQSRLKESNALDFDDLLFLTVKLFREHPEVIEMYQNRWKYLLIDEYQDTNVAQYTMINLLAEKHQNIFVVGDPDQSIYSWRGASIRNILNFEKDYPGAKTIRLEQNYRSHENILNAANALIKHNESRLEKNLWSNQGAGEKIKLFTALDERTEALFVINQMLYHHTQNATSLNEMVIFYRTNFQSRVFEDYLLRNRIPYVIVGGISFYHRREIKDLLAFLRVVQTPADYVAFSRTLNLPKRGIGPTTLEKLRTAAIQECLPIFDYCRALAENQPLKTQVKLSSKVKESLAAYVETIVKLRVLAATGDLQALVTAAIYDTGFLEYLKEEKETFNDRKANADEMIAKAYEWQQSSEEQSLTAFLSELSLKSTLDESIKDQDHIRLMTLHNGKGLEFEVAFLVGLEEDLLPHVNCKDNQDQLEEERRLCYVGITRAKKHLYITNTQMRFMWGTTRGMRPSRFLRELPRDLCERITPTRYQR